MSHLENSVTIIRFAADSTEDAYKLLAETLGPLSSGILTGLPKPYADRIHCLAEDTVSIPVKSTVTPGDTTLIENLGSRSKNIGEKRSIEEISNSEPQKSRINYSAAVTAMRQHDAKISALPSKN